jgi:transcriptional regulator with XRE-family HTH domain
MTQKELAEKIYVTDKAISKWERGLGSPDISILPLLADALGVTADDILSGGHISKPGSENTIAVCIIDDTPAGGHNSNKKSFFKKRHVRVLCMFPVLWACIFGFVAILQVFALLSMDEYAMMMADIPGLPSVWLGLFIVWFICSSITGFIPLALCYLWHRLARIHK